MWYCEAPDDLTHVTTFVTHHQQLDLIYGSTPPVAEGSPSSQPTHSQEKLAIIMSGLTNRPTVIEAPSHVFLASPLLMEYRLSTTMAATRRQSLLEPLHIKVGPIDVSEWSAFDDHV